MQSLQNALALKSHSSNKINSKKSVTSSARSRTGTAFEEVEMDLEEGDIDMNDEDAEAMSVQGGDDKDSSLLINGTEYIKSGSLAFEV